MVENKSTLLWIIHEGNYSGANMALEEYFEAMLKMGYQLKVISPVKGTFVDALQNKGIPTSIIPMYPWTRPLNKGFFIKHWLKRSLRNSLASLQIAIHALRANAVCTNTICMISGAIAAKLVLKPHYWFVHEFGEEDHGFRLALPQKKAYKLMHRLSRKIILNSKAVTKKWQEVLNTNSKFELLYNAVNCPNCKEPIKTVTNNQRFLMLGQVSSAKGHLIAIKAISQLKNQFTDIQLDIIGSIPDPNYFKELKYEIKKLNAQGYINIKPPVNNPYKIFHQYKALLICSRMEAFGRVTVEAMKAGLPVIGASAGGTLEIIKHGENGFIYNVGNVDELKKSITSIIEMDNMHYCQLREDAIQIRKIFNELSATKQLKQIFN